jgi:GATA-binding protein
MRICLLTTLSGLYYKLHGTHRPNSMKKSVIKRRKRVPAASGVGLLNGSTPGSDPALNAIIDASMSNGNDSDDRMSMSDEAAAEVLLGVGRRHRGSSSLVNESSNLKRDADNEVEEDDQADEAPSKARRSKRARTSRKHARSKGAQDDEGESKEEEPVMQRPASSRAPVARTLSREAQSLVQAMQLHRESDPSLNEERYAQRGQICAPHGGLDLPPLNAALGLTNLHSSGSYPASRDATAPSSRAHSHSPTSFTRTNMHHHQMNHPPPHPPTHGMSSLSLSHSHSMPAVPTSSSYRNSHLVPHTPAAAPSPPESNLRETEQSHHHQGHHRLPSYAELESHYHQLHAERRRLEEMLERTDDMISSVKRGLDQMRFTNHPGPRPCSPMRPDSVPPNAVRLPTPHGDRRESVWPLEEQRRQN